MANDGAGRRWRAGQAFHSQLSIAQPMTVVLRFKALTSVQDDSHPIVLAFCDDMLRLRLDLWRAGWTDSGVHDRCGCPAQLAGAERPGRVAGNQPACHDGRSCVVGRPVGVDASKQALLADLDGGSAIANRCIPPCYVGGAEFCSKALCRPCNCMGNPMPSLHGVRDCARPSRRLGQRAQLARQLRIVTSSITRCVRHYSLAPACCSKHKPQL